MSNYEDLRVFMRGGLWLCAALALIVSGAALAGSNDNACDVPGEEPDVIVGDLHQEVKWGQVGTKTAFTIGTYSCNIGTCGLRWISGTNQHPVIAQNMYRLKDGRFEQIGMGWLKHGFFALSNNLCNSGCIGTDGTQLGVNCADPYTASRNGQQSNLGPRWQVNASTGVFNYPFSTQGQSGDTIFKRIQVENADLSPTLNPGALYFIEGQYVTQDDAAAGNQDNNASWRQIQNQAAGGGVDIALMGTTKRTEPAIFAWKLVDPTVMLTPVDVGPDDGIFWVGAKVTENHDDTYHYEYAIFNLNSHRSARAFHVPVIASSESTNIGFRDVTYHSGEPFAATDWVQSVDTSTVPARVVWQTTQTFAQNQNANALRWGTLYNFRFDSELPPKTGPATLELFRPGTPSTVTFDTLVPTLCNTNGSCDPGEPTCECVVDCTPPESELTCGNAYDDDCDGGADCLDVDCCVTEGGACAGIDQDDDTVGICEDCNDLNDTMWAAPGEPQGVGWLIASNITVLTWEPPSSPGASVVMYEVLRSSSFNDFMNPTCLVPLNPEARRLLEETTPAPGAGYYYLVRSSNGCGESGVGSSSDGTPIATGDCD